MKICDKCRHPFFMLCVNCVAVEHRAILTWQAHAAERRKELDEAERKLLRFSLARYLPAVIRPPRTYPSEFA